MCLKSLLINKLFVDIETTRIGVVLRNLKHKIAGLGLREFDMPRQCIKNGFKFTLRDKDVAGQNDF